MDTLRQEKHPKLEQFWIIFSSSAERNPICSGVVRCLGISRTRRLEARPCRHEASNRRTFSLGAILENRSDVRFVEEGRALSMTDKHNLRNQRTRSAGKLSADALGAGVTVKTAVPVKSDVLLPFGPPYP